MPSGPAPNDRDAAPTSPETSSRAPEGDGWLDGLLDSLGIAAFRVDHATGRLLRANEACARMFGFPSAAAAVGTSVLDLYPDPKERLEIATKLGADEGFRATGRARLEARRLRADTREPIDVVIHFVATRDEAGEIARLDALAERVEGRSPVERAFRASEERFRALFDASDVGMALTDLDGNVYRVNTAFCRFAGRDEAELLGTNVLTLVHPEDRPASPPRDGSTPNDPAARELRFVRPDGEIAWGALAWSRLSDADGEPHSAVVVLHDATERHRLEAHLARMAKLESLGLLAGGIAHDFNNLLAVILANLTVVARLPDMDPSARDLLAGAEDAIKRARDLARQLVTFAKGGTPLMRRGSLGEAARQAASLGLRGTDARVDLELAPDLWAAEFDPSQMGQVIQNLLINAAQAMPAGGRIRLDATNVLLDASSGVPLPQGRYVRLRVEDEGIGIPAEHLARIFDPYFSTKGSGAGLGLAVAHSIVQRHGGHIEVESRLGDGTTFGVFLPACSAAPSDDRDERPSAAPLPAARVLVMDDEEGVRRVMTRILRGHGLEVDAVPDGERALAAQREALAAGRGHAMAILDLTVRGGMGGIEALRRLREVTPDLKAIVVSGYSDDPVMARPGDHGFAAVVEKPFTVEELEAAVRGVLGGTEG